MEWISVKDRLPEDIINVLIYNPELEGGVDVAFYDINENEWCGLSSYRLIGITHWMPLPEPPKPIT